MTQQLLELLAQAWRVFLVVLLPACVVPIVGGICSLFLNFFGIRDEGLGYAVRVLVMIGVGSLFLPSVATSLVSLMGMALR